MQVGILETGHLQQELIKSDEMAHHGHDLIIVQRGNVAHAHILSVSEKGENKFSAGATVYAGTVVEEGECVLVAKAEGGANRYDKIVAMIEESEKLKSGTENRALQLADRLVPWCLAGTAAEKGTTRNVTRAISILMVDFSCALKLSMPLAVLSAMRECGEYHITVKGGKYLEALAKADTIVFDKTGTLTRATPQVVQVVPFSGCGEQEVLQLAACLEEHFPHSMANAVVRAAKERGINTAIESMACVPWKNIEMVLPYLDTYLMDIKHTDQEKHKQFTGKPNGLALENARKVALSGQTNLVIRVPVIPTFNDSVEEIKSIASFASTLPGVKKIHLLPYHRLGQDKYDWLGREYKLPEILPPEPEHMELLKKAVHSVCDLDCQIGG